MGENSLGQLDPSAHQKRRPVNGVEPDNVLADHMDIGRPVFPALRAFVRIARRRDVIGERIDPHIHDVLGIVGYWNTPIERRARNRKVAQARFDEARDLVASFRRQDEARIGLVMGE